ncbi:hypothetical protein [uncultured Sulfitobacter sp.]|uniref:hypothetical protein n=1 Tax=uncultured Sulfitobacter sp. TaxID=191468 RepID=UPI0030D8C8C0|tara:strand:+ start:4262 stop:4717 length:456 start_codon:yes stop_codon:yes gene_type:complete
MTFHIRHHTENADRHARNCVPQPRPAKIVDAPSNEATIGEQMLAMARREGHKASAFTMFKAKPKYDPVAIAITEVMSDQEMRPFEIAAAVSEHVGFKVSSTMITDRLRGSLAELVVFRDGGIRNRVWTLKSCRLTTSTRLAMAIAEAEGGV